MGIDAGISDILLIYSPHHKYYFKDEFQCLSTVLRTLGDPTGTSLNLKVTELLNRQSLFIHSKTCFASCIKTHKCQLHLQVFFPSPLSRTVVSYSEACTFERLHIYFIAKLATSGVLWVKGFVPFIKSLLLKSRNTARSELGCNELIKTCFDTVHTSRHKLYLH